MNTTPRFLQLTRLLADNAACDGNDVLDAKILLADLGFYQVPDWGVTKHPDRALFDAIRAYQKEHHLKVDGLMRPGGETEGAIRTLQRQHLKALAENVQSKGRNGDTILAHISPAEARLLDAVTDGGSINPETGLQEYFDLSGMLHDLSDQLSEWKKNTNGVISDSFNKLKQGADATKGFAGNYLDMRYANVKNSDKYFHCKANCEASRRGKHGEHTAKELSIFREWWDQTVKGYPHSDSMADQKANRAGRAAAKTHRSCRVGCAHYRPKGLPSRY